MVILRLQFQNELSVVRLVQTKNEDEIEEIVKFLKNLEKNICLKIEMVEVY